MIKKMTHEQFKELQVLMKPLSEKNAPIPARMLYDFLFVDCYYNNQIEMFEQNTNDFWRNFMVYLQDPLLQPTD